MGALHEGHLSLIRAAKRDRPNVVVSIFVNPLQFGEGEDFEKYPRNLADDGAMAESAGATIVFAPSKNEVYPEGSTTRIVAGESSNRWEGEHRPGHFDGVATVVCKLLNIVQPNSVYFGRKDFQQCAVIASMIRDLNIPVRMFIEPTIRELDGLAMSSRNRYLSNREREVASRIHKVLSSCKSALLAGSAPSEILADGIQSLVEVGFSVDYLAFVDDKTLAPLETFKPESSLIFAGRIGNTRLIDNIQVG